jgi:hypothetical protein
MIRVNDDYVLESSVPLTQETQGANQQGIFPSQGYAK